MACKTLFICGTDTDVGKTVVSGALLAFLRQKGMHVTGFKPIESGCGKKLIRRDTQFLKRMSACTEPLDYLNPYSFEKPLAPGVAAARRGIKISFAKIKYQLHALQNKYEIVLVEGAGGLLVPLFGTKTNLDLIRSLNLEILLVARLGLGTINHTLLTLACLKSHKIKVRGVILNSITKPKTLAEKTNPQVLKQFQVPLWGVFPHIKNKTASSLAIAAKKSLGKQLDNWLNENK